VKGRRQGTGKTGKEDRLKQHRPKEKRTGKQVTGSNNGQ
jgi:hypothetical protein